MKILVNQLRFPLFLFIILLFTLDAKSTIQDDMGLSQKESSLVAISSLTAQGKTDELSTALNEGLDAGLTINEINEALVQLYAYCGFPRSLNGITTFMNVVNERRENGITDEQGREITVNFENEEKYEQGLQVLGVLTQRPQSRPTGGFGGFAPRVDTFLKEHLFADIFGSDVLTYHQRELVTIAALASMTGVESQLRAHLGMGMNVGVTERQLDDLFSIIQTTAGEAEADTGRNLLQGMRNL